MAKKDWLMWLALSIFGVTGVNVLLRVLSIPFPLLDAIVVFLGFVGILAMTYGLNEFKYKSLLDLALMAIIVGVLALVGVGAGAYIPNSAYLIKQIFDGFLPLIAGVVVGGIISVLVGLVNLKAKKK